MSDLFINSLKKVLKLKLLDSTDWSEGLEETQLTVKLIGEFGIEKVYGVSITGDFKRRAIRYSNYKMNENT